mgnify:CR=1 FL=1
MKTKITSNRHLTGLSAVMCHLSFSTTLVLASALLVSCDDFLQIEPLNEVILENYWTEKSDVTTTVTGCYEVLSTFDCMTRMAVWGEMRSENVKLNTGYGEFSEILKENLLPSNTLCKWASFYDAINRCNTVCYYAPQVQAIDPNYTLEEMKANIAEVKAIRALCYFYLIRAFRDVPYTTRPSIDDTESFAIPASSFEDVADSLIADLKSVVDDAVRRYYTDDSSMAYVNSSKVTRWMIYALLADISLWKGDWDAVINYCDQVLDFKKQQYLDMVEREGNLDDIEDRYGGIPMILDKRTSSTTCGNAYNEIFGTGNSYESIFEICFLTGQNLKNQFVQYYYGGPGTSSPRLKAPDFLSKDAATGQNTVFKKTDGRCYASVDDSYRILKYVRQSVTYSTDNVNAYSDLAFKQTARQDNTANWIVYRLSDILLMKAEALIERNGDGDTDAAYDLIAALDDRANGVGIVRNRATQLKKADYSSSKEDMETLLLLERHREFLFEGKRWFDLVRFSRRDGNTNRLTENASRKYVENVNAIKIKLADPNIIYFPYYKDELKVNPYLVQNPAFSTDETSSLKK